jgi:hypothetical protein
MASVTVKKHAPLVLRIVEIVRRHVVIISVTGMSPVIPAHTIVAIVSFHRLHQKNHSDR